MQSYVSSICCAYLPTFELVHYIPTPMKYFETLGGKHYINVELLRYQRQKNGFHDTLFSFNFMQF